MLVSSRFKAIIIATVARHSAGALTIERAIDFLDHTRGSEPIFHPSRLLNLRRKESVPTGTALQTCGPASHAATEQDEYVSLARLFVSSVTTRNAV